MCEPTHSILQYRDPNDPHDSDDNASAQGGYSTRSLTAGLTKWAKKILGWMHLSKMGSGHSETIGARAGVVMYDYDERLRLYEADWWNRTVKMDGGAGVSCMFGKTLLARTLPAVEFKTLQQQLLDAATEYANQVSIGNLTLLRRFITTSMQNSDKSVLYAMRLRDSLLNAAGRKEFDNRFKGVFRLKPDPLSFSKLVHTGRLEQFIKFTIGWTRKRGLLVPEWADDTKLWANGATDATGATGAIA